MALLNRLDAATTRQALAGWLAGRLPNSPDVAIDNLHIPQSAGMSMTTILFDAAWRYRGRLETLHLVARVAPPTPGVHMDPDLAAEFTLLQILGERTDVIVPNVRWHERDRSVLGTEFVVMDRVEGEVPSDDPPYVVEGWVLDLDPARRGLLYEGVLQAITTIQGVDWHALGLGFLDKPQFGARGLDQQLGYLENVYGWACEDAQSSPTIDLALQWAKDNRPSGEDLVLNWGDARIGNIIFGRDDLSVRAVLDWEMATIASPEMDLGWLILIVRYYSEGIGVPIPEGLPTREQLIERWESLTGRHAAHIEYYEAFAALRLSILMVRVGNLMVAAGALPAGSSISISNPASQILAKLLSLPAPEGESINFIGNRSSSSGVT